MSRIREKELDEVVGRRRLPNVSDRNNLPYMDALIAEIQRPKSQTLKQKTRSSVVNYKI